MCTVSWLIAPREYVILFNRDEARTRSVALPPACRSPKGMRYLAPTDPDGNGTWIGANEAGFACCILNDYGSRYRPSGTVRSRGLIAEDLLSVPSQKAAVDLLRQYQMKEWRPFHLLLFEVGQSPVRCNWNGSALAVIHNLQPPFSSSAFRTDAVTETRRALYPQDPSLESLRSYHASHVPEKGAYSVCMHRDDASTVSFSQVRVHEQGVEFSYLPASPCRASEVEASQLRMKR